MADGEHVRERALGALAAVVGLALGVSVLLAAGAYAAARLVGLTDNGGHQAPAQAAAAASHAPSPTAHASRKPSPAPSPSATKHQTAAPSQAAHDQQTHHPQREQARADRQQHRRAHRHSHARRHQHQRARGTVTLHTSASRVQPMARVDLNGRCGCGSGTTLVVQRLEHGQWSRFPATATASGGRFHTWVMTGRPGPNQFRVVAPGGHASEPVTITIR